MCKMLLILVGLGADGTARLQGLCCDVTSPGSVARLASVATGLLGGKIDVWINNAGYSGSFQVRDSAVCAESYLTILCYSLRHYFVTMRTQHRGVDSPKIPHVMLRVMFGRCAVPAGHDPGAHRAGGPDQPSGLAAVHPRRGARHEGQSGGGHIFNMDGAGADGQATPQYAAYGATKAGVCAD